MNPYACHNRPAFRSILPMQAGYYVDGYTRTPRLVPVPFRMSPACQYTHTQLGQADARCSGCRHRVNPSKE